MQGKHTEASDMQFDLQPKPTKSPSAYLDRLPVRALAVFKLIESVLIANTALYAILYMTENADRRANWLLLFVVFALIAAFAVLTLCEGIGCMGTAMGKSRSALIVAKMHGFKIVLTYIGMALTGISFLITLFAGGLSVWSFLCLPIEFGVQFFVLAYEKRMKYLFHDISQELDAGFYKYHNNYAPSGYAVFFAIISGILLACELICLFVTGVSDSNIGAIMLLSLGMVALSFTKNVLFAVSCRIYSES